MAIVQELSNIVSTAAHDLEPAPGDDTQVPAWSCIQVSMAGSRLTEPGNRRTWFISLWLGRRLAAGLPGAS
jgi:hypothetical protein